LPQRGETGEPSPTAGMIPYKSQCTAGLIAYKTKCPANTAQR
jgi:hypothetical protein